ncbi:MAG: nucleoside hydrolase, partial [Planctomycetes bacterium]|nr:nucleoside hydrolase [Planctomycetota bacterium]
SVPAGGQETGPPVRPKLVLDCDTANEIDDLYAIVRMLRQERFEVLALNSAQWFHYETDLRSVYASQRLNEELVRLLGRADLPTPVGSEQPMGHPWGGDQPKDSHAARFIIDAALRMPDGQKLYVVCTGASTNLASAIKMRPEIAPRIKAYVLGFWYDRDRGVWNKSEFNVRRDLNAANFLLDCERLELHVMTATVSGNLKFEREDSFRRQARMGKLGAYLTARWLSRFPEAKLWTMWDVALIEVLIRPELAAEEQVQTPPENRQRKVWMYHRIDADRMRADFWKAVMPAPAR